MDQLFAPWRIEWVERDTPDEGDGCVFCQFAADDADRTNRVVARNGAAFVLLNNYPYNPGHVMVIPVGHTGDIRALEPEPMLALGSLTQATVDALEAAIEPDGYNVGMNLGRHAGGSIRDHLHVHVVPRWGGDTNYMPVIADTTVIVQAVEETYDRLHGAFADLPGANVPDETAAVDLSG